MQIPKVRRNKDTTHKQTTADKERKKTIRSSVGAAKMMRSPIFYKSNQVRYTTCSACRKK